MRIRPATFDDRDELLELWQRSVRATHDFLTEEDIKHYHPLVRDGALKHLELWILVDEQDTPTGFMALDGRKLEMLFLDPGHLRQGGGSRLVAHARRLKGALQVDVNEQNLAARRFYEAMGFVLEGRSELDSSGRPFPLLHLHDPGEER